ncbi:lysophospholipid acyltransferase family protein [Candidatus Poribacteria bacterium]|nr:lysophospholipid acyltransferase family protein [Candidatus Poribacteria bacterium]
MRHPRSRMVHLIEYALLRAAGAAVRRLPAWLAVNAGALAGALAARLFPLRRRVVEENLRIAFGGSISASERKRLVREAYKSLGMMAIESFYLQSAGPEWIRARVTETEGAEHVQRLLDSGRNFICVTAHFGNWELLGAYTSLMYRPTSLSKPLHNPRVQRYLAESRQRHGLEILWTDAPSLPRQIIKTIREGRVMTFLPDQDMRGEGIFVPFLGREASTTPAPAVFSIRQQVPLLPVYLLRLGITRHRLVIHPPIEPEGFEPSDLNARIIEMTGRHTRVLEDMIRLYPAQYFWFHRRWKSTPQAVEKHQAKLQRRRARQGEKRGTESNRADPAGGTPARENPIE